MSRPARSRRRALILAAVGFGLLSPLVPSSALAEGTMPAPEPPPAVSPAPPPPAPPAPPAPPPPPPAPVVVAPPAAPAGLDPRCGGWGKVVCASKSARMLWLVDNGVVTLSFQARFGGKRTPTREGTFAVGWKSANHKSKLYRSSMPYAMFFSGGQAVHYSSDFARRGWRGASHGCVNLRDKAGAAVLFQAVPVGTRVVISR